MQSASKYKEYHDKFNGTGRRLGRKNILASEYPKYIQGGATLDAKKFPVGYNEAGHLIARNTTTGKFQPYTETNEGILEPGFDQFSVLDVDFNNDGVNDIVTGFVVIEGSVYRHTLISKLTEAFIRATKNIHYV